MGYNSPKEKLKRRITELEKIRRSKKNLKKKNDIFVQIPESMSFLDTATMPMILSILLELHSLQSYS
jgi:hypothetical protein